MDHLRSIDHVGAEVAAYHLFGSLQQGSIYAPKTVLISSVSFELSTSYPKAKTAG